MKKIIIIGGAIICSLITVLYVVGRFTGMLTSYTIPAPVNDPNIKVNDRVYVSNLKDPQPYNFIVFKSSYTDSITSSFDPDHANGSNYLYRLCAGPGDMIVMKNGTFWVNDKNFDERLDLKKTYRIINTAYYLISEDDINEHAATGIFSVDNDSAMVTFDNALIKKNTGPLSNSCLI